VRLQRCWGIQMLQHCDMARACGAKLVLLLFGEAVACDAVLFVAEET